MDWLRRNWPDLAIGIALVAVIAGIIATLVTGGSFFPTSASTPSDPPPVTAPAPAAPTPASPTPVDVVPPDADVADVDSAEAGATPAPAVPGVEVLAPDGSPAAPAATPAQPPAAAPAPAAPAPAAPAPTPAPAQATTPAPTPAPAAPAAAAPAAPAPTTSAGPLPSASTNPEAPYRVSVGAFGNPDNAARQATTFREAGFPVFTGTQGDLTIVLVGPYASEADALAVAARIRAGNFGIEPVIYRFQPDAASAASSTPAPTSSPAPAAAPAAPAPAPAAAAPVTSSAGRYLQVGAFASAASAQPLRDQLASLGFATSDVTEGGLVKVLVGPFDAAALTAAQQRLAAQGIESFAR